ncbi:MAG: hypothetical protein ACTSPA_03675 [Promethearchaeota archaeon]
MEYLFILAIFGLLVIIIAFLANTLGNLQWWMLGGDITNLIAIFLILFFIKRGHSKLAVYSYTVLITSFLWYYIFQDLYSGQTRTLSRLFEMISLILVTTMLLGLYAIQRRQIILHTIIANLLIIGHFAVLIHNFNPEWDPNAYFYLIFGLLTINISFLGSILIYKLSHNLMILLVQANEEKLDAMAQVVDEFLPICANCKAIRQDDGSWKTIEEYITDKSKDVKFSHGLCLTCAKKLYPDFDEKPEK